MTVTAVITAMESEYNAVKKLYAFKDENNYAVVQIYGQKILLIKSGIGKVNAALAAQKACDFGADIVITTGLAGGIDNQLTQGDIVVADKICYHDVWCGTPNALGQVQDMPLYYETESDVLQKVIAAGAGHFKSGLTVTGDQFLTDKQRLQEIKSVFPAALAVDMESAAIAQTCFLNNKIFLSLRIISDVVGKPEQEAEYVAFWQNMPTQASVMVDIALRALSPE